MDESYQPRRKKVSRVRERYVNRQRRREAMVPPQSVYFASDHPVEAYGNMTAIWRSRAALALRDAWWYITHTPVILIGILALSLMTFLIFMATHLLEGRIFPNVWSMGVYIGDMTLDQAQIALLNAWNNELRIELVDGDRTWSATPAELGLQLNAKPIAEAARNVRIAGMPMGWDIEPVIEVEYITAQNYILDLSQRIEIPPYNAGYKLEGTQVIGITGREGRMLDVGLTMEHLMQDSISITETRRMDLIMTPLQPEVIDPAPYLEQAQAIANLPVQMIGYDPFENETMTWATNPDVIVSWLEASLEGLRLRQDAFAPFLEAQNASLTPVNGTVRYLEASETMDLLSQALNAQNPNVSLRIRYRPSQYEVVRGDSAYGIARKTGIPYFLFEEANFGRDLNTLSVGDVLNVPSRDVTLPLNPVPNKRIIVNLEAQSLKAYENGQLKFEWLVSSGMDTAPTSPGTYQILDHNESAFGSSYTLCSSTFNCGQWEMYWFMGIYEVTPGLVNGFHGAVLLPNGAYLGGGNVGAPYTFGCIMSLDSNAKLLYDWADQGTIVEIISNEYPPQSEIARQAFGSST